MRSSLSTSRSAFTSLPPLPRDDTPTQIFSDGRDRVLDERLFDRMMKRCLTLPMHSSFEPVLCRMFDSQRALLWMHGKRGNSIYFYSPTIGKSLNRGDSLVAACATVKTALNCPIIDNKAEIDQLAVEPMSSNLFIPLFMRSSGNVVAVCQLTRIKGNEPFDEKEMMKAYFLIRKFAIYGTSMLNPQKTLKLASEISFIQPLDECIMRLTRNLEKAFHCSTVDFYLYRPKSNIFAKFFDDSCSFDEILPLDVGIISHSLRSLQFINEIASKNHVNYLYKADGDPNQPVICGVDEFSGQRYGVALRGRTDGTTFSVDDDKRIMQLMPFISRSLAFSCGFAQREEAVVDNIDNDLSLLLDKAYEISDIDHIIDMKSLTLLIQRAARRLVNCEDAKLLMVDDNEAAFQFYVNKTMNDETSKNKEKNYFKIKRVLKQSSLSNGIAGLVLYQEGPIKINSVEENEAFDIETDGCPSSKIPPSSLLAVPIYSSNDKVIAVLELYNRFVDNDNIVDKNINLIKLLSKKTKEKSNLIQEVSNINKGENETLSRKNKEPKVIREEGFMQKDEDSCVAFAVFCGITIQNALNYRKTLAIKKQINSFFSEYNKVSQNDNLTINLNSEVHSRDDFISALDNILKIGKQSINASRISIYLLTEDEFAVEEINEQENNESSSKDLDPGIKKESEEEDSKKNSNDSTTKSNDILNTLPEDSEFSSNENKSSNTTHLFEYATVGDSENKHLYLNFANNTIRENKIKIFKANCSVNKLKKSSNVTNRSSVAKHGKIVIDNQITDIYNTLICCVPLINSNKEVIGVLSVFSLLDDNITENEHVISFSEIVASYLEKGMITPLSSLGKEYTEVRKILTHEKLVALALPASLITSIGTINSLSFDVRKAVLNELPKIVFTFFESFRLKTSLNISNETLFNFVNEISATYNHIKYFNWTHAINTLQFVVYILNSSSDILKLSNISPCSGLNLELRFKSEDESESEKIILHLDSEDVLCLFTAALCHDANHHGFEQRYNVYERRALETLFNNQSVLEINHCQESIKILSKNECNLTKNFENEEKKRFFYDTFVELILSTDMSKHFHILKEFTEFCHNPSKIASDQIRFKQLLMKIILKCADIGDCCRKFEIAEFYKHYIPLEFFMQGDIEHVDGFLFSNDLKTRKTLKKNASMIPFYENCALPLFKELSSIVSGLDECTRQLQDNIHKWAHQPIEKDPLNEVDISSDEEEMERIQHLKRRRQIENKKELKVETHITEETQKTENTDMKTSAENNTEEKPQDENNTEEKPSVESNIEEKPPDESKEKENTLPSSFNESPDKTHTHKVTFDMSSMVNQSKQETPIKENEPIENANEIQSQNPNQEEKKEKKKSIKDRKTKGNKKKTFQKDKNGKDDIKDNNVDLDPSKKLEKKEEQTISTDSLTNFVPDDPASQEALKGYLLMKEEQRRKEKEKADQQNKENS